MARNPKTVLRKRETRQKRLNARVRALEVKIQQAQTAKSGS